MLFPLLLLLLFIAFSLESFVECAEEQDGLVLRESVGRYGKASNLEATPNISMFFLDEQ